MYTYQARAKERLEVVLCIAYSSHIEVRTKYICMLELQNINRVISMIPSMVNVLIFAFKSDTVQYKDKW